jgi:hypothetical protein
MNFQMFSISRIKIKTSALSSNRHNHNHYWCGIFWGSLPHYTCSPLCLLPLSLAQISLFRIHIITDLPSLHPQEQDKVFSSPLFYSTCCQLILCTWTMNLYYKYLQGTLGGHFALKMEIAITSKMLAIHLHMHAPVTRKKDQHQQ